MTNTFAAIDFETAIGHHICSVGIVTVEKGKIIEEFHTLIKPPNNEYHWRNTEVHGITEKDTLDTPFFGDVFPKILKRIEGKTLVAHNESFDRRVLSKTMQDYGIAYSKLNIADQWECTLKIYREKGYKPAGLAACYKKHNIPLKHHDALSDDRACVKLFFECQFGDAIAY